MRKKVKLLPHSKKITLRMFKRNNFKNIFLVVKFTIFKFESGSRKSIYVNEILQVQSGIYQSYTFTLVKFGNVQTAEFRLECFCRKFIEISKTYFWIIFNEFYSNFLNWVVIRGYHLYRSRFFYQILIIWSSLAFHLKL